MNIRCDCGYCWKFNKRIIPGLLYCPKCGTLARQGIGDGHRLMLLKPPKTDRSIDQLTAIESCLEEIKEKRREADEKFAHLELRFKHEKAEILARNVGRAEAYKQVFGENPT